MEAERPTGPPPMMMTDVDSMADRLFSLGKWALLGGAALGL